MAVLPSSRWQTQGNRFTLIQTVAPTEEPVSLLDMKNHVRLDFDDAADDDLLRVCIMSARMEAENITRRTFITSTWLFSMDRFPSNGYYGAWLTEGDLGPGRIQSISGYSRASGEFSLPLSPVQSVTSVGYTDSTGASQSIDPSLFTLDASGYPSTIMPVYGTVWPTIRAGLNGVSIVFVAGYGSADDVPAPIKQWIKVRAASYYQNRESEVMFRGTIQELSYVDRLLDPFRIIEL